MTDDRKRRWDDQPTTDSTNKAVKTEEGASAGGAHAGADAAAQAAAAIAARFSAQHAPAPPSDAPPPPPTGFLPPGEGGGQTSAAGLRGMGSERDRDRESGLFVEDIEINDLRNRYLLTKGPTQQQILADTGASVLTKGVWYPDKSMATEKDPPLYLHITAESADKLALGVAAVRALIDQDLQLLAAGAPPARGGAPGDQGWGNRERRKWPEEKIFIEFDSIRNFNVKAKTVGPGGLFVKFIQQETQTRVQIKGQGSGYIETDTGRESDEPIHINITGPDQVMIDKAVEMAKDLLEAVREKHAEAKEAIAEQQRAYNQPQQHQQHGQQGQGQYGQQGQGQYGQQQQQQYGQPMRFPGLGGEQQQGQQSPYAYNANQYAAPGLTAPLPPGEAPPAPPSAAPSAAPGQTADPSGQMSTEAYTAWWNSLDAASQAYYTQYYAAYAQYTAVPAAPSAAAPPPSSAPPPPPPSDAPPPPPPPGPPQGGNGMYGAVPPPLGL